jgi:hypothetical protein
MTRKYGGVPGWGWVALIAVVAGGVLWYISKKKGAASTAAGTSTPQGPTQATCYDANGATVACSDPSAVGSNATDYFEALYAQSQGINSQLQNLTPTVTETGQDADAIQAWLQAHPGPPSTPPPGKPPAPGKPGPVTALTVATVSPTLARVSWRPPQFASHAPTSTTYTIEIQGKDKGPHNIGSRTAYNVGGLHPGGHYTAVVAAAGGPSTSRAFTMPGGTTSGAGFNPGGPNRAAA